MYSVGVVFTNVMGWCNVMKQGHVRHDPLCAGMQEVKSSLHNHTHLSFEQCWRRNTQPRWGWGEDLASPPCWNGSRVSLPLQHKDKDDHKYRQSVSHQSQQGGHDCSSKPCHNVLHTFTDMETGHMTRHNFKLFPRIKTPLSCGGGLHNKPDTHLGEFRYKRGIY